MSILVILKKLKSACILVLSLLALPLRPTADGTRWKISRYVEAGYTEYIPRLKLNSLIGYPGVHATSVRPYGTLIKRPTDPYLSVSCAHTRVV